MAMLKAITIIFTALALRAFCIEAAPTNIIKNPGFESGVLAPWKFVNLYPAYVHKRYKITQPGLDGQGKYKFEYDAVTGYDPGYEGSEAGFAILQNVTLVKAAPYSLAFTYLNQPKGGGGTLLFVKVGASNWTVPVAPENKIVTFKRTFNASGSAVQVGITFDSDAYLYDQSAHTQIDNVRLFAL